MWMSISGRQIHQMTTINDNYHSHIYSVFEFHSKSVPKENVEIEQLTIICLLRMQEPSKSEYEMKWSWH